MTDDTHHLGMTPPAETERDRRRSADGQLMEDPHAALERAFIDEFLGGRGHTMRSMADLREEDATALLRAAAAYATLRLTEIESRAHFIAELHP